MADSDSALAFAAKLMGRPSDNAALDMIMKGASVKAEPDDEPVDESEDLPSDGEDDLEEEVEQSAGDDPDEDTEEEESEEPEFESATYSDDDVVEVTVDGEVKTVSLGDLKKRYSGEGAIEKRLQEATELRKAASAAKEAAVTEVEQHRTNLLQTIATLDSALFMPLVKEPDPALRQQNMQLYLLQQDAYKDDQQRIQQLKSGVVTMFQTQQQEQAKAREAYREQQAAALMEKLPELRTAEKAQAFQADVLHATEHYGFTRAQVAEVDNHALLMMARDAGRWLKMQEAKNKGAVPNAGEKKPVRKLLKSGGTTAKPAQQRAQKAVQQAELRARKSGSVDDIAAMLTAKATATQKRR